MNKKEKQIAGQILWIASDKRMRVLKVDQLEWLERKMTEIKRLVELLPNIPFDPDVGPIKEPK